MIETNSGSYSFPSLTEKKKDKDYHKRWAQAIVHNTIDDNYANRYRIIAECYKFLEEGTSGELTSHLQKAEDGTDLPAPWLTLNTLKTKIDLLIGELEQRGYEIKVRALNKEAISRKIEEKEKLRVRRKLDDLVKFLEQETGMPLEDPEQYVPQTENELSEYFDLTFKDKAELIMEGALKYLAKKNQWDEERKLLFKDILAAGRAIVRNEIVRGIPRSRRIDPLCFIHDPDCKTDTLEDATYFGEVEYLPMASAAERYNLTDEQIKEVYSSYSSYLGAGYDAKQRPTESSYDFGSIRGNRLKWFKNLDGQLRVLVIRAVWRDYKIMKHKHDVNERYGTEHLQEITENVRKRDSSKVMTNKFEVWRQCTLIGGMIVREAGECPNQARDLSDLESTEPPYKVWIPNYSTGRGVSKVEQISGIQLAKDLAMYNMNVALTRAGAKGMIYDLAMVPEGWSPEVVMKYMKVFGVGFINSKESQMMPGNMNLFKEFDMTLSNTIFQYIEIMRFYDAEMDKISGVSPERQGMVQGASQAVGVTESALFQSNLITAPYFKGFERFCSRVLNHQAKLVKIVFPKAPDIFSPIIGDVGVDFLREHIELDLDEFGVFVESQPPMFLDRQKLEQMLMIVVQSDPQFIDDALAIMMEPDTKVAIRHFQRKRALRKVYEAQMQQAQQEREAQMQEQMQQLEAQRLQAEQQTPLELQNMKNQGALERTLAQGRVKLNEPKVKAMMESIKPKQ
jgi:hypothetical protein